jgi:DNA-binding winged helix-turn-helix (wHTH) protein
VISKDELMEQVWTGTLVTENAISRTLVKVRKALADDPKSPRFIITVPRKGYRMVANFSASDTVINQSVEESQGGEHTPDIHSPESSVIQSNNVDSSANTNAYGNTNTCNNTEDNLVSRLESQSVKNSVDKPVGSSVNSSIITNSKRDKAVQKYIWLISGLVIITIIVGFLSSKGSTTLQTKQIKPLTRDVGVELYPALSPDLTQLAYSKTVSGKPSYINIENVGNHVKRSVSHARGALSKPIWSPTQDKLAFLYKHNSVCTITWAELSNIKDKNTWQDITECGAQANPHFVFSPDGKYLYFNDRQSASHGYQIFRVNLENNEKDIVNQPITNGLGNYSFDISANGKHLVMANSEFSPVTRIYTLNIDDSLLEQTAQVDYLMRSVIWHHDNETIIHPSPHPAYELWQSRLDGNKLAVVASNTSRIKHLSRINNGKDFSFVSYLINRNIHFESKAGKSIELDNSTVMDYLPALANNSQQYAFVSKRSTSAEVYLSGLPIDLASTLSNASSNSSISESTKQLSFFNNPVKLYDLAFSPNDSQLMILADNQIHIANNNTMAVNKLPLDNVAIAGVSWQDENTLLLSTIKNSDWSLMTFNLNKQKLSRLPVGYQGGVYSSFDKSYYLIEDDSFNVMKFSDLSVEPQATSLNCQPSIINRKLNLKVTGEGLVCKSAAEGNQQMFYSFTTRRSQVWQKSTSNSDFYLNKNGMIYTKMKESVSDIMKTTTL